MSRLCEGRLTQGIGAALSNTVPGIIVVNACYTGFVNLAAVALAAFMLFLLAMPETGKQGTW